MPQEIIDQFKKQYGKRGEQVFYATANAQGRNPETFKKKRKGKSLKEAVEDVFGS